MNSAYEKLTDCYESVKGELPFKPKVALVLGSGLGDYVKKMKVEKIISTMILMVSRYLQFRDTKVSLYLDM